MGDYVAACSDNYINNNSQAVKFLMNLWQGSRKGEEEQEEKAGEKQGEKAEEKEEIST